MTLNSVVSPREALNKYLHVILVHVKSRVGDEAKKRTVSLLQKAGELASM